MIEIYQPRWHDRRVLIATYKVSSGVNYIKFTKSPTLKGVFEITGDEIRKCPRETNGTIVIQSHYQNLDKNKHKNNEK